MKQKDTPIGAAASIVGLWSDDPLLLFQDVDQSRSVLNDLLKNTFKATSKTGGDLVLGQFKLEQVWQQIEHHTNKVNSKIMHKVSQMATDEDFVR